MTTRTMRTALNPSVLEHIAQEVRRAVEAIAAGQRAARDYWRLTARTDTALAREGLTREQIPQAVYRRNFR